MAGLFSSNVRLQTRGATSQRDVVVYLKGEEKGTFSLPSNPAEVLQTKLQFEPHVLPILKGTSIVFRNADGVTHNVFSTESCCPMNQDMPAESDTTFPFKKTGVASVVCRLHPDMSLWIIVLDNPWFTRVEVDKAEVEGEKVYHAPYKIDAVPPGSYTLTFWNKKLQPREFPLTVQAGEETRLDISIAGE